jgi:acyl-homoserine-lactone acylase
VRSRPTLLVGAALATALAASLVAPAAVAVADTEDESQLQATIRRTENGVPHIVADDYAGLGFGYGYAFAQDNICTAADFYVTVNGERSRFFGADGAWTFHGNGTRHNNLDSDAYYQAVNASGRIEELLEQDPPHGPGDDLVDGVAGYVAGYNAYLEDVGGPDGVEDPRCAGQEWVRPIDELDAYRRFYQLASLASTGVALGGIGGATPPTPDAAGGGAPPGPEDLDELTDLLDPQALPDGLEGLDALPEVPGVSGQQRDLVGSLPSRFNEALGIGSNAYGFGSQATASGSGMVLGNPHFPWVGGERLYQAHLTIPGKVDVQGASLYGVPIVLIGTTEGLAWSHTVSTAFRFTPVQLTLVPGSPTTYLVDGEPREMERREVTIETEDGEKVERTVYWTDYGPVITEVLGLPLFPWTPGVAFAMADANDHLRYLNHFFEKNHAQDVDELLELTKRNLGVPWVNTIAADASGRAYYSDISVVPNVDDDKVQACPTPLGIVTFVALGLPVLDGARSDCNWDSDDDAVAEGVFGPGNLPHLIRDDYVHNGNDSYWLSNPNEPLEGFARIIGDERAERTLRTRIGLTMVEERLAGQDPHVDVDPAAGDRWSKENLKAAMFDNRQYAGELMRDDLVELCASLPGTISTSGPPAATDGACDALAEWDLRDEVDSTGGILFRRFLANLQSLTSPVGDPTGTGLLGLPWQEGFDADDPVHTPNTLNTSDPRVATALGDAINDLKGAGIPLDAPLGDWQYVERDEGRIPIHGGPGGASLFNAINVVWQGDPDAGPTGYPDVPHGASFVMAATWSDDPDECPVQADALVTYGQSENPESQFFADQTQRYSDKDWVPMHFCEQDVLDHTVEELVVAGQRDAPEGKEPDADPEPGDEPRPGQQGRDRAEDAAGERGRDGRDRADDAAGERGRDRAVEPHRVAGAQLPATGSGVALLSLVLLGLSTALGRER